MFIELKFGLITGVGVAVFILLEYIFGFHTSHIEVSHYVDYLGVGIPIITVYLGIKAKRDKFFSRKFSFGRGVLTGVLISFIFAASMSVFIYNYIKVINPQFIDSEIFFQREKLVAVGTPDEIVVQKVNEMRLRYGIGAQLITTFFGALFMGTLISCIMSAKLKTGVSKTYPSTSTMAEELR